MTTPSNTKDNPYLKEIGIEPTCCSYNTSVQDNSERDQRFADQRKAYGFDERETWHLTYTVSEWLYCHLKMYLEVSKGIVDLEYHKFKVQILQEPSEEYQEKWEPGMPWHKIKEKELSQKEAITTCIEYLKRYLTKENKEDLSEMTGDEFCAFEQKTIEQQQQAFRIFAEILPVMWW